MFNRATSRLVVLILLLVLSASAFSAIVDLPKTGQTEGQTRFDDGASQTGREWPSPRFVDNGDGTISDKLTGLMWLKDISCADTILFLPAAETTQWQDAFAFVEKLNDRKNTVSCLDYTASYTDWHVPNVIELNSLFNYSNGELFNQLDWLVQPTPPSQRFENVGSIHAAAWSSTTYAGDTNKAWVVDFINSKSFTVNKDSFDAPYHVFSAVRHPVNSQIQSSGQLISYHEMDDGEIRAGRKHIGERFVDMQNGTIIDRLTGLQWLKNVNCLNGMNWLEALEYIDNQNELVHTFTECLVVEVENKHWRMANILELQSLIDYGQSDPALATGDLLNVPIGQQIISATNSLLDPESYALGINIKDGSTIEQMDKNAPGFLVWPVAIAQPYADIYPDQTDIKIGSFHITQDIAKTQTLALINPGTADLSFDLIEIKSNTRNEFTPGRDQCSNQVLQPKSICEIEIRFQPKQEGLRHGQVVIPSNALGQAELVIPITGTGLPENVAGNLACFIATAAFGSPYEPHVARLRGFRDQFLLGNRVGEWFVNFYYENSPPLARFIREHTWAKSMTQLVIVALVSVLDHPLIFVGLVMLLVVVCSSFIHRSRTRFARL